MKRLWGDMRSALPMLVCVLAFAGIIDSAYLTLAHYGLVDMHVSSVPDVCPIAAGGCEQALTSPQAALFGVPVALLGAFYFSALLGASALRVVTGKWPVPAAFGLVLAAGLAFSIYMMRLLFVMADPCPYCLVAHSINFTAIALCAISFGRDGLITSAKRFLQAFTKGPARWRWRTQP